MEADRAGHVAPRVSRFEMVSRAGTCGAVGFLWRENFSGHLFLFFPRNDGLGEGLREYPGGGLRMGPVPRGR